MDSDEEGGRPSKRSKRDGDAVIDDDEEDIVLAANDDDNDDGDAVDTKDSNPNAPPTEPAAEAGEDAALAIGGTELGPRDRQRGDGNDSSGGGVYVANLGEMTDEQLRNLLKPFGDLESCSLVKDPHTRASRGFAFATYMDGHSRERAIKELDG